MEEQTYQQFLEQEIVANKQLRKDLEKEIKTIIKSQVN